MISRITTLITTVLIFTSCTNSGSSSQSNSPAPGDATSSVSGADAYAGPIISDFRRNPDGSVYLNESPNGAARFCLDRGLRLPTLLELLEEAKSHGAKFDVANSTHEYCRYYKIGEKYLSDDDVNFAVTFKDLIYSFDGKDRLNPNSAYESPGTCHQVLKYADRDNGGAEVRSMFDWNRRQYYTWTRSVSRNPMGGQYQHIAFSNYGNLASNVEIKLDFPNQRFYFYDRGREIKIGVRCVGAESL